MVGRNADGRRDVRKVSAKTQGECRRRLHQVQHHLSTGVLPTRAAGDGLGAYLERWLASRKGTVRARTHLRYAQLLRKHVVPALGRTRLPALKPDALARLYVEKATAGLSARTVHHVHTVLHTALAQALEWGYVGRNVAAVVAPPAVPTPEPRWPTPDEVRRLLDGAAAAGDRLHALWALAAHTGMRQGELLGLGWDAVDLDAGTAHVRRILVGVRAQTPTFGEPKTRRSRRVVPLTADAAAALRAHRARQNQERLLLGEDYGPSDLVFATQVGTPILVGLVTPAWKRALRRAGLPASVRFHDLRHAAATTMLANGVDVPTVAAILGHARNSTTLDVYAHAVPTRLAGGVEALQRAFRSAGGAG